MNATRWWLLAIVAAAGISFAAGRWTSAAQLGGDPLRMDFSIDLSWLGLTPAQAAELEAIEQARQAVQSQCDDPCAARCSIVHALKPDAWDPDALRDYVERMCAAHRARELATLDYLIEIERILTPKQRASFLERVSRCLCELCASGEGACCKDSIGALNQQSLGLERK